MMPQVFPLGPPPLLFSLGATGTADADSCVMVDSLPSALVRTDVSVTMMVEAVDRRVREGQEGLESRARERETHRTRRRSRRWSRWSRWWSLQGHERERQSAAHPHTQ